LTFFILGKNSGTVYFWRIFLKKANKKNKFFLQMSDKYSRLRNVLLVKKPGIHEDIFKRDQEELQLQIDYLKNLEMSIKEDEEDIILLKNKLEKIERNLRNKRSLANNTQNFIVGKWQKYDLPTDTRTLEKYGLW
jgi:hypothetical protein